MPWIRSLEVETAEGKAKELLESIQKKIGWVPSAYKVMAQTPEFAQKAIELNKVTFKPGALDTKTKQLIAFAVAAVMGCEYCLAAHAAAAQRHGASHDEIAEALATAATMSFFSTYNKTIGHEVETKPKLD